MIILDDNTDLYRTAYSIHFMLDQDQIGIPKGFVTDLASIPRIFWGILPPHHWRYRKAAIIHDYLIANDFDRKESDLLFKHLMLRNGVKRWKVFVMYNAVRLWSIIIMMEFSINEKS